MHKALEVFNENIEAAKQSGGIYQYLSESVVGPISFDDLLRSQLVNAVSAFDKLIHDLVRIGIVQTYLGQRAATPKYLSEPISIQVHTDLVAASIPPKEFVFEQAIIKKLKVVSYQEPGKVAEGLSYIWSESQKWQKISAAMSDTENNVKTTLKLIADRRNAIVHEADTDPLTNGRLAISKAECDKVADFLQLCGNSIAGLVSIA